MISLAMMAPMPTPFEVGVFTFGDHGPDPLTGASVSPAERAIELLGAEVAPRVRSEVGSG